ncbi:MAG TPA: NUDIX domain-containing protein, partial [Thauera aminoaromatica]|nr:NUDIX domain-containing protein [Thauera aminoaromatica]
MDVPESGYPPVAVSVDVVVFTIRADLLAVLLVRRGEAPHLGEWALPGGFIRPDEDLDHAAHRELAE